MWMDEDGKIHYRLIPVYSRFLNGLGELDPYSPEPIPTLNPNQLDLTDADKEFLATCGISI